MKKIDNSISKGFKTAVEVTRPERKGKKNTCLVKLVFGVIAYRSLTQALQSPINWNFNDYNGGDTVEENHIELEMNRCELTPNDMPASDNDDILSTTNSTVSGVTIEVII